MFSDDPTIMSATDRLDEVAALMAAGFLRLKRLRGCLPAPVSESAESSKTPAESPCHLSEDSALCRSG